MEAAGRPTQGGCCRGEEERGGGSEVREEQRQARPAGKERRRERPEMGGGPHADSAPRRTLAQRRKHCSVRRGAVRHGDDRSSPRRHAP